VCSVSFSKYAKDFVSVGDVSVADSMPFAAMKLLKVDFEQEKDG